MNVFTAAYSKWKEIGMAFLFEEQAIKDVYIVTPQVFSDSRGCFMEAYKRSDFEKNGIPDTFIQDNESSSVRGTLRGLHFQKEHTQGKLIRVVHGSVYDVAVDVRPGSPTFGKHVGVILNAEKRQMLFIPRGFAHGFLVLSDHAKTIYKCTDEYDPTSEGGIPWNDSTLAIPWPALDIPYITSEKDERHPGFREQDFGWAARYLH